MTRPPDRIGGPSTTELAGLAVTYAYSTGERFHIEFRAGDLEMHPLDHPDVGTFTIPYRARLLRDGLYLVGWTGRDPVLHVCLVLDIERRQVHVCGLMPGGWEYFDVAEVSDLRRSSIDPPPLTTDHALGLCRSQDHN